MQMSTVDHCLPERGWRPCFEVALGGSVPGGRPNTMLGRAQGAGLSEPTGSRQRVAENVPVARRRSAPENGVPFGTFNSGGRSGAESGGLPWPFLL